MGTSTSTSTSTRCDMGADLFRWVGLMIGGAANGRGAYCGQEDAGAGTAAGKVTKVSAGKRVYVVSGGGGGASVSSFTTRETMSTGCACAASVSGL